MLNCPGCRLTREQLQSRIRELDMAPYLCHTCNLIVLASLVTPEEYKQIVLQQEQEPISYG